MTVVKWFLRAVKSDAGMNSNFEQYYSRLMGSRIGETGLPTAREAQRDQEAATVAHRLYPLL